ncbi:unnamed protein product [Parajaminaea phylloscopi]
MSTSNRRPPRRAAALAARAKNNLSAPIVIDSSDDEGLAALPSASASATATTQSRLSQAQPPGTRTARARSAASSSVSGGSILVADDVLGSHDAGPSSVTMSTSPPSLLGAHKQEEKSPRPFAKKKIIDDSSDVDIDVVTVNDRTMSSSPTLSRPPPPPPRRVPTWTVASSSSVRSTPTADIADLPRAAVSTHENDDDDDDDDFFIRKRPSMPRSRMSRSASNQRAQLSRESSTAHNRDGVNSTNGLYAEAVLEESEHDDEYSSDSHRDDDNDEDDPPSSYDVNGRKRKRPPRHARLPSWTRNGGMAALLPSSSQATHSSVAGDDEDGAPCRDSTHRKHSKKKDRSVSLTPPPPMDPEYRRKITEIVDNTLASHQTRPEKSSPPDRGADNDGERSYSSSPVPARNIHRARPMGQGLNATRGASREQDWSRERGVAQDESQSASIHPDLAPYLRGSQAAELRRLAKLEEEKMKKQEAERRAAEEVERRKRLEQEQQRREKRQRTLQEAAAVARAAGGSGQGAAVVSIPDSSDSEASRTPIKSRARPRDINDPTRNRAGQGAIALSDNDSDSGSEAARRSGQSAAAAAAAVARPSAPAASASPNSANVEQQHLSLMLRSKAGKEMRLHVKPTTTFRKMLDHFLSCTFEPPAAAGQNGPGGNGAAASAAATAMTTTRVTRQQLSSTPAAPLSSVAEVSAVAKMMWDGQVLGLDATVESVEDLEDDEIIDVLW